MENQDLDGRVRLSRRKAILIGVTVVTACIAVVSLAGHNEHKPLRSQRTISLSIAKEYRTLAELRRDANVVALVSVVGVPILSNRLGNIPTVDAQLQVEKVIAGAANVGDSFTLVQIGDPSGRIKVIDPIPPILQNGKRYVVYLNRQFPDQPQMMITGQAGVFEASASAQFIRLGDASPGLPKNPTLDQF